MKLDNVVRPLLEQKSGKEEEKDFGICVNPEFMRESTAIHDFYHPPFTIIGTSGDRAAEQVAVADICADPDPSSPLTMCPLGSR